MANIFDAETREIERAYYTFLNDQGKDGLMFERIQEMIRNEGTRLIIDINYLRAKDYQRSQSLITKAAEEVACLQRTLKDLVTNIDKSYSDKHEEFFVGFEGSFGARHLTPRQLSSHFLNNLVCVEGVVTQSSVVRPKVVRSVHYCPSTAKTMERRFTDLASLDPYPSQQVYPTTDDEGNLLWTEYGHSVYRDQQSLVLQELPEKAPTGLLPRALDVFVEHDLVDSCKPGDALQVIGIFRCLPAKRGNFTSAQFRTILLATNIKLLRRDDTQNIDAASIKKIKQFANKHKDRLFPLLANSIAPSIHGHEMIKKAILCQLLGGVERTLIDGGRIRGDINILLVGDPSVAKSQMLRYVLQVAPRAVATTGRGSSGVGLTAAVTTDMETGERRLEAGAVVLADRGLVAIDEFDKMTDADRTTLHEALEQGRVTISKAGIQAHLNARCAVLAAANPVLGRYNPYQSPMENIGLQDALLSRFDLIFVILDKMDEEADREISDHVLRMHRYRPPGEPDGSAGLGYAGADFHSTDPAADQDEDDEEESAEGNLDEMDVEAMDEAELERFSMAPNAADPNRSTHKTRSSRDQIVSMRFLRQYLAFAKKIVPALSLSAAQYIAERYTEIRSQNLQELADQEIARTQPVTARTLETLIRLATAHARARLSPTVTKSDAEDAFDLIEFALYQEVSKKPKRRNHADSENEEAKGGEAAANDANDAGGEKDTDEATRKSRRRKLAPRQQDMDVDETDPFAFDANASADVTSPPRKNRALAASGAALSEEDYKRVKQALAARMRARGISHDAPEEELVPQLTEDTEFSASVIRAALLRMQEDNLVLLADGQVFLIA